MEKYYFTFGSCERFPYKNTYLVVVASSLDDATAAFREKYPDIHENCLNCSFWYNEEQWEKTRVLYEDKSPAEVIFTETCFGKKPEGYGDLFIFVPEMKQIVRIFERTGDNLLPEDQDRGYVDYIYYEQYELGRDMPEVDGGQVILEKMVRDQYQCMADSIQDVLSMAYGSYMYDCMILA